MFKKVFFVFVAMLIFLTVPVYADDVYTLQPGKIYKVYFNSDTPFVDVEFSDNVLFGFRKLNYYYDLASYDRYGMSYAKDVGDQLNLLIYNITDSPVTLTVNNGEVRSFLDYGSNDFTVVPFDGTRTPLEVTNTHEYEFELDYKLLTYNDDGSLDFDSNEYGIDFGETQSFDGRGVLIIDLSKNRYEIDYTLKGVYELGDYFRSDFFQMPPWILGMDLSGILGAFLENLPKLLQAGLVVLSVFLLINLARYMVRLFL